MKNGLQTEKFIDCNELSGGEQRFSFASPIKCARRNLQLPFRANCAIFFAVEKARNLRAASQLKQQNMAEIRFNSGAVNAAQCIGDGWQVVKGEYLIYFLMSLLAVAMIFVVGLVPFVGGFIGAILGAVLNAGILYAIIRRMRGDTVSFGEMFAGFEKVVPLMLLGLIQAAPTLLFQMLQLAGTIAPISRFPFPGGRTSGSSFFVQSSAGGAGITALTTGIIVAALVIFLIVIAFSFAWGITFYFVYPLVMEHNLSIGEAILTSAKAGWSNALGLILLFLLQGLMLIAGVFALCIGFFFVLPILYSSHAVAYRQVFPALENFAPNAPPPPTDYGSDYGRPTNYPNAI